MLGKISQALVCSHLNAHIKKKEVQNVCMPVNFTCRALFKELKLMDKSQLNSLRQEQCFSHCFHST